MSTPDVPGYTGLQKIGAGGFAAVYRATQDAVGREVALKLLHHAIADEETERRFQRECRVVGSLSWHPHIAAVLDAGADEDGRSYLAFELLPGGSLGDRLEESGPIPWKEAVTFAIQMADALAAAHDQDVLHRDVKPDNILIDRLGQAKLADFGIAQMRDGNQTKSGVITATFAHAAPEVLSGKRATKASDVYLLGSTLFELMIGEPPFGNAVGNDFFAAIQRIATEPAPKLVDVGPGDMPGRLSNIVDRALQKEPSDRFDSVADFGMALRELQSGERQAVTPMPFVEATSPAVDSGGSGVQQAAAVDVADPSASRTASPANLPLAEPTPSPANLPLAEPTPSPANLPLAEPTPRPEPHADRSSTVAAPLANIAPATGEPQRIDYESKTSPPQGRSTRSKLPLLAGFLALAVVAGAAFLLTRGGGEASTAIEPIEALQTGSQQGLDAELTIDGDLATGWLSPNGPDGHEIVIGFGSQAMLDSVSIHAGPDPSNSGPLANSRGLGPVVLEFSDGSEMTVDLDPAAGIETITIGRQTSSLAIRTLSQGNQPVAIREVEFTGEVLGN